MAFDRDSFERKFMEGWNHHKVADLLELYSNDMVYRHQGEEPRIIRGKEQFKLYLKGLWNSIPDFEFKLLNTVWNGCWFCSENAAGYGCNVHWPDSGINHFHWTHGYHINFGTP